MAVVVRMGSGGSLLGRWAPIVVRDVVALEAQGSKVRKRGASCDWRARSCTRGVAGLRRDAWWRGHQPGADRRGAEEDGGGGE